MIAVLSDQFTFFFIFALNANQKYKTDFLVREGSVFDKILKLVFERLLICNLRASSWSEIVIIKKSFVVNDAHG